MPFRLHLAAASLLLLSASLSAQTVIGDLYASDASVKGSVTLVAGGTQVLTGSSVTAGEAVATLKLARGGELRVCPTTSISVSAAPGGKELMIGLGTGAMEAHYQQGAAADTIMTPDFRILLAGPGDFHLAFGADVRGNTCVRSLPSNNAAVVVTELMGDGSYQVRPGDQVLFRGGRLAEATGEVESCGCPPPAAPVHRAQAAPAAEPVKPAEPLPPGLALPKTDPAEMTALTAPPPPLAPTDVHISVEAPFVFRAEDAVPPPPRMAHIEVSSLPQFPMLRATPEPPPASKPQAEEKRVAQQKKPRKKGFFGRVGGFFASLFGG